MKRALFIIAALLILSWVLGFFVWNAGTFIHICLIIAAIFCMQAIILTPKALMEPKTKPA
ncbi:DUF5670 family protein [Terrimonas sp. NA20]|uniref:DUF5670 family protein n=1 Tax=Terrimonas ginsenosidimutans TaxID=2908004 RepID=A0ABS9KV28_9BACT|nr:DUF5670 family protein [Terrimonas ginsenosidimutans]MCG2616104.1 DUF5670 family protein [Terrimonas ginsenosidimutans]